MFMNKIITIKEVENLSKKLKEEGKSIVLVGGCFDIFHYGHFRFLKLAKEKGDILIVALESDETVKNIKGLKRPITPQNLRAEILTALPFVDYVLLLNPLKSDKEYYELVSTIKPSLIALTEGDRQLLNKTQQAKEVGAKIAIIKKFNTPSTSEILSIITSEL